MTKRLLLCVLIFCALQAQAMAATYPVIVQVKPLTNILNVVNALGGGSVLDSIPGTNIYLLGLSNLPVLQTLNPILGLLGIQFIEYDKVIAAPGRAQMGVLSVGGAAADWYNAQPSLQLIQSNAARAYSTGRGIVVADLNSKVDYAHPALAGHLKADTILFSDARVMRRR
jgi:hypothetical protein